MQTPASAPAPLSGVIALIAAVRAVRVERARRTVPAIVRDTAADAERVNPRRFYIARQEVKRGVSFLTLMMAEGGYRTAAEARFAYMASPFAAVADRVTVAVVSGVAVRAAASQTARDAVRTGAVPAPAPTPAVPVAPTRSVSERVADGVADSRTARRARRTHAA